MIGYTILCYIYGGLEKYLTEIFAASFGLGLGSVGVLLFWLSLGGLVPSRSVLFGLAVICMFLLYFRYRTCAYVRVEYRREDERHKNSWALFVASVPIAIALLIVFTQTLMFPNYEWDAYMLWGYKARVLSTTPILDANYFKDLNYFSLHLNYPLMIPFLMAGINGINGDLLEVAPKMIFPVFYIVLILFISSGLLSHLSRWKMLVIIVSYMTMSPLLRWSGSGLADVPLATFYAGCLTYLLRWTRSGLRQDTIMASIFAAFCGFSKNEGCALIIVTFVGILAWLVISKSHLSIRPVLLYGAIAFGILAPWFAVARNLPDCDKFLSQFSCSIILENVDRLLVIASAFFDELVSWGKWNGIWMICLFTMVAGGRHLKNPPIFFLSFIFVAQLWLYVFIYLIHPHDLRGLIPVTMDRLLIQLSPVAILLIGLQWEQFSLSSNKLSSQKAVCCHK